MLHKEENFKLTRDRLESEGFAVKECRIANEVCWLIFPPHMGVEWNEDNMIYRSGIWNNKGEGISLSWKKFFNWDEQCELAPKPKTLDECNLINKEDGSTLLISMYKGELIMRTRGTVDMTFLSNGKEKEILKKLYPKLFSHITTWDTTAYTYVFEWETPSNKIVLDYGDKPRLVMTGVIDNFNYEYLENIKVDRIAEELEVPRPCVYGFNSFDDLQNAMTEMKGIEGICVYFNGDQDIKKMKTEEYLMLHSVKFKLGYKALIDMIFEENTREKEFKAHIERRFDHEGLTFVEKLIEDIYLADYTIKTAIEYDFWMIMHTFKPEDKKDFAQCVYNGNKRYAHHQAFLFKMWDNDEYYLRGLLMKNSSLCEKFKKYVLEVVKS